jgi:hypothetical protein
MAASLSLKATGAAGNDLESKLHRVVFSVGPFRQKVNWLV